MKKLSALFLTLLMCMAVIAGCTPSTGPEPEEPARNTLRMASTQTYVSIDPHFRTLIADGNIVGLTYESFYSYNSRLEFTPRLAERHEISEDGLEYTYYLKENAKFHDGEDVKASDVVFSIERAKKSPTLITQTEFIDKVEEIDEHTVKITLSQVVPAFFTQICDVYIVSEKTVANAPDKYEYLPAGSGPYTIETWKPDEKVVLKRNEDYHGEVAPIEMVEYIIFGDSASALLAFEAGEIDYIGVPKADWSRIVESGLYNTQLQDGTHTTFMVFNMDKEPFNDLRVRQAFSYAVNKEDVLFGAMEDLGQVATMVGTPWYCQGTPPVDEIFTYEYNPEKAKQLLAEAGYPEGLTLAEPAGTMGGNHFEKALAIVQAQLADVGVNFDIEVIDSAVYGDQIRTGNFLFQVWGISTTVDAGWLERVYGTSGIGDLNGSRYSNPEVDRLFAEAKKNPNEEERLAQYHKLFNICAEDAVIIPLYWQSSCIAWNKDLNVDIYKSLATWSWK